MVVLIFIGILIALYVFTLVFAKFKSRKFQINEAGIIVSKGTKEKTYSWNNFEYFFTHSVIVNRNIREVKDTRARITANDMIAASDQLTEINGKTFYLKKNKQNFWDKFVKTFVVIYTKPDNSAEVEQTLSEYLPHKPMDNATEAGLVKYEFK
jgi:hypothetical protein